jgi:hypothetical protein
VVRIFIPVCFFDMSSPLFTQTDRFNKRNTPDRNFQKKETIRSSQTPPSRPPITICTAVGYFFMIAQAIGRLRKRLTPSSEVLVKKAGPAGNYPPGESVPCYDISSIGRFFPYPKQS